MQGDLVFYDARHELTTSHGLTLVDRLHRSYFLSTDMDTSEGQFSSEVDDRVKKRCSEVEMLESVSFLGQDAGKEPFRDL